MGCFCSNLGVAMCALRALRLLELDLPEVMPSRLVVEVRPPAYFTVIAAYIKILNAVFGVPPANE